MDTILTLYDKCYCVNVIYFQFCYCIILSCTSYFMFEISLIFQLIDEG